LKKILTIPTAEPFLFPGGKTGCVLIHGFTGAPKEMRLMGEDLNKRGITALGVRLAGHATQPEDLIRTRWWDWQASVEDGINLLKNMCDHIFLAGLSLGGVLALTIAARISIRGVIAMSTPYILSDDWRLKFARPLSLVMPMLKKEPGKSTDREIAAQHVDYPAYPSRSLAEVNDLTDIMHALLPEIKAPVLLINSKSDPVVPLSHAEKIKQLLTTKIVRQVILENSGHVITEGLKREVVFDAAYQFISQFSKSD